MFVIPFQEIIFANLTTTWVFFVSAFAILGGGIKYIDDAFDENTFSKLKAMLLAPVLGVFWAYTMSLNPAAATILAAVVLDVFFSGKIDTLAFMIGTITIFSALFLGGLINFLWIPLILITLAGIIDEKGNDFVDKHPSINRFVRLFFEYRFVMKIAVGVFAYLGYYAWVYFAAFLAFDIAYAIIMLYSKKRAQAGKFYYNPAKNNKYWGLNGQKRRNSSNS